MEREQNESDLNNDDVNSLVILRQLWVSGKTGTNRRLPTVHIPEPLASYYHLNKPCKITFRGMPQNGGILIKFFSEIDEKQ